MSPAHWLLDLTCIRRLKSLVVYVPTPTRGHSLSPRNQSRGSHDRRAFVPRLVWKQHVPTRGVEVRMPVFGITTSGCLALRGVQPLHLRSEVGPAAKEALVVVGIAVGPSKDPAEAPVAEVGETKRGPFLWSIANSSSHSPCIDCRCRSEESGIIPSRANSPILMKLVKFLWLKYFGSARSTKRSRSRTIQLRP